jgi:hypothetical protein
MAQFNSGDCVWNEQTRTWVFTSNASIDMSGSTGSLKGPTGGIVNGGTSLITSVSANAFTIGPNGVTNPSLNLDTSTASAATGLNIKSAAAGSGISLSVLSSGANEGLSITSKGTGSISVKPGSDTTTAFQVFKADGTTIVFNVDTTNKKVGINKNNPSVELDVAGSFVMTNANAQTFAVGPAGITNPSFNVDTSTASAATGLNIKSAAAAAGLAVAVISSGTNENLTLDAKGSGTITLASVSTGNVVIGPTGKLVIAGTVTAGGLLTNAVQIGTSGPLIYSGSGAPTISAAVQGSLYLRTDGSSTSTRLYVATNTSGTWTAVTTAA